jgi:hypothetical protein
MKEVDTISQEDLEAASFYYDNNILGSPAFPEYKFVVPENILKLKDNEIFVFGSNMAGIHGAGAAVIAKKLFGAQQGKGYGLYGKTFAIPTKDQNIKTISLDKIKNYVNGFIHEAEDHKELTFLVTRIGCGLAGYTDEQIAPLFKNTPKNVLLPKQWKGLV